MIYPLVSIITVNYNQASVTCELLESLRNATYPEIETLVVDNGSREDPKEIESKYPEIRFIVSEKNLGFAGGNNLGVRQAKGKYLLFLNNDTEVEKGFIEPMIELFEKNPEIGMISPKIRFHHTPDTIQYAGISPMNPYTMRQHLIGLNQKDTGQFDQVKEVFSIHGAAMMVPMKVVKEVGMMFESYFLYYEEHDWAYRIKEAGYKTYYQPISMIFHKESISTGKESPLKIYYISRNRFLFARRNYSGLVLFVNMVYLHLVAIPKNSITYLMKGRFDLFKAFWRAMFWNFSHLKGIHDIQELKT